MTNTTLLGIAAQVLAENPNAREIPPSLLDTPNNIRQCGGCNRCCEILAIEELGKPRHTPCEFMCAAGCAIYKHKPQSCNAWSCEWRHGLTEEHQRPDNLGAVIQIDISMWCVDVFLDKGVDEPTPEIREAAEQVRQARGITDIVYYRWRYHGPGGVIAAKKYRSRWSDKIDALTHSNRRAVANLQEPAKHRLTNMSQREWMYEGMAT